MTNKANILGTVERANFALQVLNTLDNYRVIGEPTGRGGTDEIRGLAIAAIKEAFVGVETVE